MNVNINLFEMMVTIVLAVIGIMFIILCNEYFTMRVHADTIIIMYVFLLVFIRFKKIFITGNIR